MPEHLTLVVLEHDGSRLRTASRAALGAARALAGQGPIELLALGSELGPVAEEAARLGPTIVADAPALRRPTADRYAHLIAEVARERGAGTVVAASTTFARDILPRACALLRGAMAGDVTGFTGTGDDLLLRRPVFAGGATATVRLLARPWFITVRASAFSPAAPGEGDTTHPITRWAVDEASLPAQIESLSLQSRPTDRPDVSEARVVVSGGRAFRSAEEFEQYAGALASALGGATGCTRALVDAGIAPNEWQVGQTGKIVAPDLYVALGLSGAVQHLAGMKNSRVIVAVNNDPDAPIFSVANYGLVGDVRVVVPQLIEELAKDR